MGIKALFLIAISLFVCYLLFFYEVFPNREEERGKIGFFTYSVSFVENNIYPFQEKAVEIIDRKKENIKNEIEFEKERIEEGVEKVKLSLWRRVKIYLKSIFSALSPKGETD